MEIDFNAYDSAISSELGRLANENIKLRLMNQKLKEEVEFLKEEKNKGEENV